MRSINPPSLAGVGPERVEVVATERPEMEDRSRRNFAEFLRPSAHELCRLIHVNAAHRISTRNNEQNSCFARLLNQGSSLE